MMKHKVLTPDSEATLLLCGDFDGPRNRQAAPLTPREFNDVLGVLRRLSMSVDDLLTDEGQRHLRADLEGATLFDGRIGRLLDRRAEMDAALERWLRDGIQVIDRTHPDYPERYRWLLAERSPPLMYMAGDISSLNADTRRIAVIGSRDIDRDAARFALALGKKASDVGASTVSGGARGVDRTAVDGALEAGGAAIVVLPGDLLRVLSLRRFRDPLAEGRLVLVSPYPPEEPFSGENALGRNRLIYCLADVGVVVETSLRTGGTWAGATDVLKHGWVPVYVRQTGQPSPGNQELIRLGAHPLPSEVVDDPHHFAAWLESSVWEARSADPPDNGTRQLGLFPDT